MIIEMDLEKLQEDFEAVMEMVEIDETIVKITIDGEIVGVLLPPTMLDIISKDAEEWLAETEDEEEEDDD